MCPGEGCSNRTIEIWIGLCPGTGYNVQHCNNRLTDDLTHRDAQVISLQCQSGCNARVFCFVITIFRLPVCRMRIDIWKHLHIFVFISFYPGYKVIGAFIQNKFSPKAHNDNLLQRAAYTCDKLNIPLHEVTLPPEGWEEFERYSFFSPKQSFLSFSPSGWRGNCFTALGGWACGLAAGPNLAEHLWNHWMDFFVQSSVHLLRPAVVKRHSHPHMGQTHYGPNDWPMRNWYSFQPLNLVKGCPFSDLWVVGCCSLNVF